ncbi:hypothetical protein SDRG_16290 [Saprolegnia diclina VS20]|uniref:MJ1316 RNA cyclic group end recognition domain-containing protein n=1 Tax=Saprolegnia diclina (strain VS20) TaxID=1156394 RepID=T0PUC9_SAPDV|nr:hypothetical protein SDRG_16290 [Saprolegnia diclina VS20]EQC25841.1 hypothetical protein SDRG_16290 [Saprolegnia diclina VS20]|eukprot:XP_008620716.1 hypothetical protein SDRG_16290 [Saprolegnia diclina VS20]
MPPQAAKHSMRTANDVIHRILWDDCIPQAEVIVGYLDRFVGTVERDFAKFNWGDIATLSQNETAIPQHRIQYFKWRDEVIWDKRVRLDRVFGSSGHDVVTFSPATAASSPSSAVAPVNAAASHISTDCANTLVCFRIMDPAVVDACKQLQAAIIAANPRLAPAALAPARFHCTLLRLRLQSLNIVQRLTSDLVNEVAIVKRVLVECQGLLHTLCTSSVKFEGVSAFRNRVIYAKAAPHDGLLTLVATLKARLLSAGIALVGNYDPYEPHIQLFKLTTDHRRLGTKINAPCIFALSTTPDISHLMGFTRS